MEPAASCPQEPLTTDKGIILKSLEILPHGRVKNSCDMYVGFVVFCFFLQIVLLFSILCSLRVNENAPNDS